MDMAAFKQSHDCIEEVRECSLARRAAQKQRHYLQRRIERATGTSSKLS